MGIEGNKATIKVPSSTANLGLLFDMASLGIEHPSLYVTVSRGELPLGITVKSTTQSVVPEGRVLGHGAKKALENFLMYKKIFTAVELDIMDNGFPVGGLGRSGAEAVGAIMATAVLFDVPISSRRQFCMQVMVNQIFIWIMWLLQ